MNNITPITTVLANEVTNVNINNFSSKYLPTNDTQINDFPSHSLADRQLSVEPAIILTELPDILLDILVSKLSVKDLSNISLVCKRLLYCSRYYLNNFYLAQNLFKEYSIVSQKKIIRLFNKENYNKHLKPWLANFADSKHVLNYLDGIQHFNNFHQLLFFYITKIIQQTSNIKVNTKFTQTYNDISQSVGFSSNNTNLFVATFDGVIKIYGLNKNKNFILCYQSYLGKQIEYAKFSPDGNTIVIQDFDKKVTIIYSIEDNNWEIDNSPNFENLQISSVRFTPNSKFMIAHYQETLYFYSQHYRLTKWIKTYTVNYPNMLTTIACSYNSEYCASGENSGGVAINLPKYTSCWKSLDIEMHNAPITDLNFSVNSKFFVSTAADNMTNIYILIPYFAQKIFSIVTQSDQLGFNFAASACFTNDSNTVVVNHGKTITIVNNLLDYNNITTLACELISGLGKVCISNNSNYIIIYTQKESLIKLYTKNDKQQWFNIKDIDTKVSVKLIKFSANEQHFVAISSTKTVIYNLCDCKQLVNNFSITTATTNDKTKSITNKKLTSFIIETPEEARKHIIFNPYFCQLLVAYNNVIKIFTSSNNYLWSNKLTLKMDMPIETVQYTNNGSHIVVNNNNDNLSNVKLLAVN